MLDNIRIICDTHLGHSKMIKNNWRPENFTEKIALHLFSLPDNTILIHLGDICMGNDLFWHERVFMQLPYKKILVTGNHDNKSSHWYREHGWDFVCRGFKEKYFGKYYLFSHKPEKYDGWFDYNIHGHFHNSDHRRYEPEFQNILTDKHILLAIENTNYQSVSLKKLLCQQ